MITFAGLDMNAFLYLVPKFAPLFDDYTPFQDRVIVKKNKTGRKRKVRPEDCLALVLAWTRTRAQVSQMQLLFGMTYSNICVYLKFGLRILVSVLSLDDQAKVRIPDDEKLQEFCEAIEDRHPLLKDVWCCMDGLKLTIQQAPDFLTQSRYYNGWKCDHFVTAVLCFCPDGTIPMTYYNVCGVAHDSNIARIGSIYNKLVHVHERTGLKCVVNSAFRIKGRNQNCLIKSGTDSVRDTLTRDELQLHRAATSMRQAAEWGMGCFQSSFPRCLERFKWDDSEYSTRRLVMKCMILLFNFRARFVGINQIRQVYMPYLDDDPVRRFRRFRRDRNN
jgi:hypothetical protein